MLERHQRFWPAGLPYRLGALEGTIYGNLERSAKLYPEKPALIFYGTQITYADLKRQVDQFTDYLTIDCGIRKGDRVLIYLQNSPQFVIAYYAILGAGAVVVPANPMVKSGELRHYALDSGARFAVIAQELFEQAAPLLDEGTLRRVIVATYSDYLASDSDLVAPDFARAARSDIQHKDAIPWAAALASPVSAARPAVETEDLCVMPYTSGTTGKPKGCMHTHGSVLFSAMAGMEWLKMQPEDVVLGTLPFFHVTGMQRCMNGPIYCGNTVVLMIRWDRDTATRLIERYRVTTWTGVPTMFVDLLSDPSVTRSKLKSLKRVGGGGAGMPEAIARRMDDLLGVPYVEGYGLSETIAPTHINPPDRAKRQCLGIPIFNTDARIIDPEGDSELELGAVGEIVIHGPQLFQGYWNQPEATAEVFVELDGKRFFRTGDLGKIDDDGYFFMVDRLKRMINASGFKVWPAEVEALMYGHPDIQEVCVIGAPDSHRGETVKAIVVLKHASRQSVSEAAIIDWAREHMAAYKAPRIVEFLPELPKSDTGKIQWRLLQELQS